MCSIVYKRYLWSLKALAQYLCVVSFSRLLGKLTIDKAPKGHFWKIKCFVKLHYVQYKPH